MSHFTCNNSKVDLVSGVEVNRDNSFEIARYSDPVFVADPVQNNMYCAKKRSGQYYLVPNIGSWRAASNKFKWLCNYDAVDTYNLRKTPTLVEFETYIDPSTQIRVIYNDGDVETGGAGTSGFGIWVYNESLCVRYKNDQTQIETHTLSDLGSVSEKWNTIAVEYQPGDNSSSITIDIKNNLFSCNFELELLHPQSGRSVLLASSHFGYYRGAQDTIDLFKEIKTFTVK